MDRDKSEIKKIGILGGSFDPAHKGHVEISIEAKKRYKLNEIIWAVTKKNPYKSKSSLDLTERINFSKKINYKYKFIKVRFYENIIKSNRTIDLIKYIKRKNKISKIYFIMGADNLINFHKWKNYNLISSICNILKIKSFSIQNRAMCFSASFERIFFPPFPITIANSNSKSNFSK